MLKASILTYIIMAVSLFSSFLIADYVAPNDLALHTVVVVSMTTVLFFVLLALDTYIINRFSKQ